MFSYMNENYSDDEMIENVPNELKTIVDEKTIINGISDNIFSSLLDDYDIENEQRLNRDEELLDSSYSRLAIKPVNPKFEVLWWFRRLCPL